MKLIVEHQTAPVSGTIVEDRDGKKRHVIEGVFMQANKQNRNKRIYEGKVLRKAVDEYVDTQVKTGRAVGELNHPEGPSINLDKVSHRILSLEWQGDDVIGKALVLDTPMGKIVQNLLEGGVQLGVSSRGMGSLIQKEGVAHVASDFVLSTVDIVQDPSAPNAFVNGIMEGYDWVKKGDDWVRREVRKSETELKEARIEGIRKFLSSLAGD